MSENRPKITIGTYKMIGGSVAISVPQGEHADLQIDAVDLQGVDRGIEIRDLVVDRINAAIAEKPEKEPPTWRARLSEALAEGVEGVAIAALAHQLGVA